MITFARSVSSLSGQARHLVICTWWSRLQGLSCHVLDRLDISSSAPDDHICKVCLVIFWAGSTSRHLHLMITFARSVSSFSGQVWHLVICTWWSHLQGLSCHFLGRLDISSSAADHTHLSVYLSHSGQVLCKFICNFVFTQSMCWCWLCFFASLFVVLFSVLYWCWLWWCWQIKTHKRLNMSAF